MSRWLMLLVIIPLIAAGCGGDDSPTGNGNPGNNSSLTADQLGAISKLFSGGYATSQVAQDAVYMVTEAVYEATRITGVVTTTGTLQQTNEGGFEYLTTPADRLLIQFNNGTNIEVLVTAFDFYTGVPDDYYLNGSHFEFADIHQSLQFEIAVGTLSLTIVSSSVPRPGGEANQLHRNVQRTRSISGTLQAPGGEMVTVALNESVARDFDMTPGYDDLTDQSGTITGTVQWDGHTITVNEWARYIQARDITINDGTGRRTVQNLFRTSSSSGVVEGKTLAFRDASVQSETREDSPPSQPYMNQPSFWSAAGSLTRDGQVIGNVIFEVPIQVGDPPRRAVVDLSGIGQGLQVIDEATLGG